MSKDWESLNAYTVKKKKAVQWEGLRPKLHIYALFNPILQGYESVSIDPDDFEGKVVLILGRGDPFYSVNSLILTIVVYYCYKKDMPFCMLVVCLVD